MKRGKNQVLYKYLPGKPIDFNQGNAIALIERWFSQKVTHLNKTRIIQEVYRELRNFTEKRGFPIVASTDSFELLTPLFVEAELFPLTFVCDSCSRAYSFGSVQQMNRVLRRHKCLSCGGNISQMDLVYYHECGNLWYPKIPRCSIHGYDKIIFNKHNSNSPKDWRWDCGLCNKEITNLNNWCPACKSGSQKYPTPFRQTSVFTPHSLTLVNLQNVNEDRLREDDIYKRLIVAKYLNLFEKYETTFEECLEVSPKEDTKLDLITADLKAKGVSQEMIETVLKTMNKVTPNKKGVRDKIMADVNKLITPPKGDMSELALRVFEFMETLEKSSAVSLKRIVEAAKKNNHPNISSVEKFPEHVKRIGLENAYVLNDLSIVKVVYGFTRGKPEDDTKVLNRFPADKSEQSKVPIYLSDSNTEAMLLEFDRWKILNWLKQNGIVDTIPDKADKAGLKAWFLNHMNNDSISRFNEIEHKVTKYVYKLLHSISHALLSSASVECGLDRNSMSELIFPSIPAIIIYCSNAQEFQTGGMFTLFENNIYPWVEKTLAKVGSCLYDPVCMDHQSACHACLFLSEFSCVHFNYDLGRDVLVGKTTNKEQITGFWTKQIQG